MSKKLIAYEKYLENWLDALETEISYWDYVMREQNGENFVLFERMIQKNKPFAYEKEFATTKSSVDNMRFVDVGSGPFPGCGKATEKIHIDVHAVDPLGCVYNRLKSRYDINDEFHIETGFVEFLDKTYDANSFDMVTMNNSLDHSFDPIVGIKQLLYITKIGGIIRLNHGENEAEFENYKGLHQWNISLDNPEKSLVIWNLTKRIDICKEFWDYAEFKFETGINIKTGQKWNVVTMIKKRDIEIESPDYYGSMLKAIYERLTLNMLKHVDFSNLWGKQYPTDMMLRKFRRVFFKEKDMLKEILNKHDGIVIYGMGAIGRALFDVCQYLNVGVKAILDIKADAGNQYINPDEYDYDGCSLIVITTLRDENEIKYRMRGKTNDFGKVIHLRELLEEIELEREL